MIDNWLWFSIGWICGTLVTLVSLGVLLIKQLKSADK